MASVLDILLDLQGLDAELHKAGVDLKRYPELVAGLEREVARVEKKLESAELKRADLEKRVRASEKQVGALRVALEKFSQQQSGVKNQKEYDALSHEIAEAESRISAEDEAGLLLLEEEEALDGEIEKLRGQLEKRRGDCAKEVARIEGLAEGRRSLVARVELERGRLLGCLDDSVRGVYETLNLRYPGKAVVGVSDGNCGGCFIRLLPRIIQDAGNKDTLTRCDSCGRFLYET